MLPCKLEEKKSEEEQSKPPPTSHFQTYFSSNDVLDNARLLLDIDTDGRLPFLEEIPGYCAAKGRVPLLSVEALHHLHVFIFIQAKSFFKQFYGSVTRLDYVALRHGFIMTHCRGHPRFNFHKYVNRALEDDFKRIVGIKWYLWFFVVIFLLLNISGWHTYFWISFIPFLILCSFSTLPLYAIVTQMGTHFKNVIFNEQIQERLINWAHKAKKKANDNHGHSSVEVSPHHHGANQSGEGSTDDHSNGESASASETASIVSIELGPVSRSQPTLEEEEDAIVPSNEEIV
ncbi:hypothetical protein TSUD_354190 [Trifolium subterraneum]|uniref:MLO-like protein n=1 Tax=Trifolium subterraneum TaxID=3900 RepID=A0A2Z6NAC4_TRISU|nr:hypothetical protein TSUD_354190 [Trifolium subterraneum]